MSPADRAKRAALALSFANLVYVRVWFDLLARASRTSDIKHSASPSDYCAALCNVLLLAAAAWCCLRLSSRMPAWLRQALVFAGLVLVVNAIRGVAAVYTPLLRSGVFRYLSPSTSLILGGIVACGGAYLLSQYFSRAARLLRIGLLACFPAVPIICGAAVVRAVWAPSAPADPPLAARFDSPPHRTRVIWAIFDEWDNRLSFVSRPKGIELKASDQLVSRSFVGTHVLGPQGRIPVPLMATQVAIPSLLAGEVRRADDYHAPNLFSLAHARGWNVAIGGWYIPYCRLFAGDAFRCYWDQMYTQSTAQGGSFANALVVQNRSLFETSMFSVFGQSVTSKRHAAEFKAVRNFALDAVSDPAASLVFLHFNAPHAPYFFDAKSGRFDASGRGIGGYADALELVDQTVAQLVERLDSNSVLILSADHPLRAADQVDGITDPHVPFIVHFPGQAKPFREDQEFSSIRTAPLILQILDGKVRTPEDADEFMEADSKSTGLSTH